MSYLLDPTLDYVSGADAQILFNKILIDECYDLQYSYREMKEPVYGYRSKRFDHVLPGTQIISGQFTINYVYDGYLTAALQTSKGILETTLPTEKDYAYAKLTGDYSKIRQSNKIKFNKQTLINNVQDITTARSKIDSLKAELNTLKGKEEEKDSKAIEDIIREIKGFIDKINIIIQRDVTINQPTNIESIFSSLTPPAISYDRVQVKIKDLNKWYTNAFQEASSEYIEKLNNIISAVELAYSELDDAPTQVKILQPFIDIVYSKRVVTNERLTVNSIKAAINNTKTINANLGSRIEWILAEVISHLEVIEAIKQYRYTAIQDIARVSEPFMDSNKTLSGAHENQINGIIKNLFPAFTNAIGELNKLPVLDENAPIFTVILDESGKLNGDDLRIYSDDMTHSGGRIIEAREAARSNRIRAAQKGQNERMVSIQEDKKRPQITQIENEIKTLNDAIEVYIKNRKKLESENWNSIMDFMDYDKQLMDTNWITDYSTRAEDVGDSFDIYIRYNGASHKILRECYLTGHAHVIMMGGEPIKEIYTFFAKYIENGEYSYS